MWALSVLRLLALPLAAPVAAPGVTSCQKYVSSPLFVPEESDTKKVVNTISRGLTDQVVHDQTLETTISTQALFSLRMLTLRLRLIRALTHLRHCHSRHDRRLGLSQPAMLYGTRLEPRDVRLVGQVS